MKHKIVSSHSCEPVMSLRDRRIELLIDDSVKVQIIHCDDKHSWLLGSIKIEEVIIEGNRYFSSDFDNLPEKYSLNQLEDYLNSIDL